MADQTLNGRHIFITGAGSGIGLATAAMVTGRGAMVAELVLGPEQAQALAALLPRELIFDGDVTDKPGVNAAVEEARNEIAAPGVFAPGAFA